MISSGLITHYSLIQKLSSGSSSEVWLATDIFTSEKVALKLLLSASYSLSPELNALGQLSHPGIIKALDFQTDAELRCEDGELMKVPYIAFPYMQAGDLCDILINMHEMLDETIVRALFKQVIEAIAYCHSRNIVHMDIKLENILLAPDNRAILTDFGFAERFDVNSLTSDKGTMGYKAPEVGSGAVYDGKAADVFSAGVVLFILRLRHPPFNGASATSLHYKLLQNQRVDLFWEAHSKNLPADFLSPAFKDLVSRLLTPNPSRRPTISQVLTHSWFTGKVATRQEIGAALR